MTPESHYIEYFWAILLCFAGIALWVTSVGKSPMAGDLVIAGVLCIGLARLRRISLQLQGNQPPVGIPPPPRR